MPVGSQQGRNTNEANIVRQGLTTAALEDGATSGQVASVTNGELEFVTASGGSQPFEVLRVPIAFNTPGLVLAGIDLGYTAQVGDCLSSNAAIVSVSTAWNGTNPRLYIYAEGADPFNVGDQIYGPLDLTQPDNPFAFGWMQDSPGAQVTVGYRASVALPLKAVVDNNSGGNPGSTQGEGEIILAITKAAP